jgi:hypothetical protein
MQVDEGSDEIIGIVFPLLPQHTMRLLEEGKKVFVKYFGRDNAPTRLKSGHRLFLYESKGTRRIVGEAKIREIRRGTAAEIWSTFGNDLFLNKQEFDAYVGERKQRSMLVLVIGSPLRYADPLSRDKPLTMAGEYMTKQAYDRLKHRDTSASAGEFGQLRVNLK